MLISWSPSLVVYGSERTEADQVWEGPEVEVELLVSGTNGIFATRVIGSLVKLYEVSVIWFLLAFR